jgi:N-acetylneuraminate synthase/N,N'-diacetyllegionaminate synthase
MKIGHVDTCERVLIVAEIGNNHEGDLDRARAMIREAAAAGADAVKFQTIVPERLISSDQSGRLAQLRRFTFTRPQFEALAAEAAGAGVVFLSTPFDLDAIDWLDALVPAYKVASGDNDFFPLLDRVAQTGKPVMVSLGFGGHARAADIVSYFSGAWRRHGIDGGELALLHCIAAYPTIDEDAGLGAIRMLLGLGITVGYSDHTLGIKAAELAVAAGARIVEKHFTLDKAQSTFRDHRLSADPAEMRTLVTAVRRADEMCRMPTEPAFDRSGGPDVSARRSIAAARDLPAGTTIESGDLAWLRPGKGFRPGEETQVVGRRVRTPIASGRLIRPEDLV